jgi:hypothetical protein
VRKDGLNHIANVLSFRVNTEDEAKTLVGKLLKPHAAGTGQVGNFDAATVKH